MPSKQQIPLTRETVSTFFHALPTMRRIESRSKKYDSWLGRSGDVWFVGKDSVLRSHTGYVKDAKNYTDFVRDHMNSERNAQYFKDRS